LSNLGDDWQQVQRAVVKAIDSGYSLECSKISAALKAADEANKATPAFDAAKDALEKQIIEKQNNVSRLENLLAQAAAQMATEDFGLDPRKPEDKKKIQRAQALFKNFFAEQKHRLDGINRGLDELDKHVIQMRKYKAVH